MLDAMAGAADDPMELELQGRLAHALMMRAETGLVALDEENRVVLLNDAARTMLGLGTQPVQGAGLAGLVRRGSSLSKGADALAEWLGGGAAAPLALLPGGATALSIEAERGPVGYRLLFVRRYSTPLAPPSRRDPLTGLSDRAWFRERLAAALAEPNGKPVLLMVDLDRFKAVNDSLGHQVGDALLRVVAQRLKGSLRGADVISRLSGDEFAVVLKRSRDPVSLGRRLVALLSRPYLIEGSTVSVGASVGVALGPEHGANPDALIHAADVALYAAKNGGRGNARLFDAELEAATRQRMHMAEALRKAIPSKQLRLDFQPQMVLATGELSGFEAFLRWDHPELGELYPGQFLPIAEATGLIWALGEWVLERACQEAMTWPRHVSVSVNISAHQLFDRNRLPRFIKSVLLSSGLEPNRLEIEVPECALTQRGETAEVLSAIDALGVRVSLDNFGTGYTSLNYLRQFPLHKIKIDHSFIQALGVSEEASNVVRAVAALGRTLGIVTAAEGVETVDQQAQVFHDGCKAFQGYVLSRPVPAEEVAAVIKSLSATVYKMGEVA